MAYRRVEITVPREYAEEAQTAMDNKLKDFNPRHPQHLMISTGDDDVVYAVNLHPAQVGEYLHSLESQVGIGVKYGLATILEAAACKPSPPQPLSLEERLKLRGDTVHHPTWMEKFGEARMSVEEIHTAIESGNSLDFNFWCFLLGAAIIAGGGLATGSAVMVVASMLISPLMGPILAAVFGFTTWDLKMMCSGLINEFCAAAVTLLCGLFFGAVLTPLGQDLNWPTTEMAGRGNLENFTVGVIFAVASGVIVGVAVTGGGINSLVGVAISASLLPPIVNAGMLLAYGALGKSTMSRVEDLPGDPDQAGKGLHSECTTTDGVEECTFYDNAGHEMRKTTMGSCYAQQQDLVDCKLTGFGSVFDEDENPLMRTYMVDKGLLYEQAAWSLSLYCMNVLVIGTICTFTFKMKHLVPDPFDKMGNQWAKPENHRNAISAKKEHVRNTHSLARANAVGGGNRGTTTANPIAVGVPSGQGVAK